VSGISEAAGKSALRSIYAPPSADTGWRLEQLAGHDRIRYFAYGRHALAAALQAAGVAAGDAVLVPAFICREVLSALHACGANVVYYPVGRALEPACNPAELPRAKAIIAVDYFGFAQNLAPFIQYCVRSGATLIEDNAHGLFSRDESGRALGTRGDLGVFSLRKTLPAPNGAALSVNNPAYLPAVAPQLAHDTATPDTSFRVKQALRTLARALGPWPAQLATAATRLARRLRTGHAIPRSSPHAETRLPAGAAPNQRLFDTMAHTDAAAECARRRDLYALMPTLLNPQRFPPVFPGLPPATVPYGYPFIADAAGGAAARRALAGHGLECFQWPELPAAITSTAPAHYRSIWMVSFLW
jgi:hypothetical protein